MPCRGLCTHKPLPAEPGRGRGVFHGIFVGSAFGCVAPCAVGGSAPVNPCPPSPGGGGVFFMVFLWEVLLVVWLRALSGALPP